MNLFITRHGRTLWNEEHRFQGQQNSDLTLEGRQAADQLRQTIDDLSFDAVYVSPLGRTIETANILFPNQGYTLDDRLKEMNFGVLEGLKEEDVLSNYGELYSALWNHPENYTKAPMGESFEEVFDRIDDFINFLIKKHSKDTVMIITHGMYIACLLAYVQGYSKDQLTKTNTIVPGCSLTKITYENNTFTIHFVGQKNGCSTSM